MNEDMIDLEQFAEEELNKAGEQGIQEYMSALQSHFTTMQLSDLAMQPDFENRATLQKVKFSLKKIDNLHYEIHIQLPDDANEKDIEIFNSYLNDSDKYVTR